MHVSLKAINDELHRLGHDAHLDKGDGYFYFWGGEANGWLDRTVQVKTLRSLTLEQWVAEFKRLRRVNAELLSGKSKPESSRARLKTKER